MKVNVADNPNVLVRHGATGSVRPGAIDSLPREGCETLLQVFDRTVARWPERTALQAPDASYTYGELAQAADGLAYRLRASGVGPGDRVAVRVRSGSTELYLAILGVLRSGAAYVPIDADDPHERALDITLRSGACATVCDGLVIEPTGTAVATTATASANLGNHHHAPATPEHDAWIIFTSGSTGTPKGVAVTHGNASAFVQAEARLWEVLPSDRVLAGLSVGFDASCEEIWLAWANGAALVPAPRAVVRAGVELGTWLIQNQITVVSTVPTLAALWDESCLHNVRLLILGGEACPEKLGWRLSAGREVWNTYGPTEATVVSTAASIVPGQPITIGWPLAGWEVAVLEVNGEPVAPGEAGELVITGAGMARYLDPELDATRYAPVPALGWERAYRTGDIVRATATGIEFVGRRDDQVKIGGRRIELGEVESILQSATGVRAAAVAVRETSSGNRVLVGYVVSDGNSDGNADASSDATSAGDLAGNPAGPRNSGTDCERIRVHAARRLPAGMVPLVVTVPSLPMTSSGKVDRRALPWPVGGEAHALAVGIGADGALLSDAEIWVAERWVAQLGPVAITPHSDFFALGGTSLAVAKLISELRSRYPGVAVADLYQQPTLRTFTQRLEQLGAPAQTGLARPDARPGRFGFACSQMLGVLVLFAFAAVPWVIATLGYGNVFALGTPHVGWLWLAVAYALLTSPPARVTLQALVTRLLLRNVKPGRYSRYGSITWRLWFIQRFADLSHTERLGGTPWALRYARLLGADVGDGARLSSLPTAGPLLSVGPGATIEGGVDLQGWVIEGEEVIVGQIRVGAGASVGARTLLSPGAEIGRGAEIDPGSVVVGAIPAGERWGGVPAGKLGPAGADWPADPPTAAVRAWRWRLMFALSLPLEFTIGLLSAVPATLVLYLLGGFAPRAGSSPVGIAAEALVEVVITVPVFAILVAVSLRLVWRLVRPGFHAEYEGVGWALWFGEELRRTAGTFLFPLYASLYTRRWLRLMGIDVGARAEVSTSTGLNPLVSLGAFSQSTDDVGYCGARARNGWLRLSPIHVGDHSFIGPGAVLRGDTTLEHRSLVGVLTLAPWHAPADSSWFGVPALELPRRTEVINSARTTNPPPKLVLARGVMDLVRLFVPNTIAVLIGVSEILALAALAHHLSLAAALALAPLVQLTGGLAATAVTVALKWIVIGRYRRSEHPLWSWFVWRDELINSAQEQLAGQFLLGTALGTPLMSVYLRLLGARVGRGVWLETIAVTEYEMIELGDGVAVNRGACLMTHLFHDRLLRIGPTTLQAGSTLGPNGAVLPDTVLGAGTSVAGHSVVMRGEHLPPGTRWQGAPVVSV